MKKLNLGLLKGLVYVCMGLLLVVGGCTSYNAETMTNAIKEGNMEMVKQCIENKVDIKGGTFLKTAIENDKFDIAKLLIENGADIYAKDSAGGCNFDLIKSKYQGDKFAQLLAGNYFEDKIALTEVTSGYEGNFAKQSLYVDNNGKPYVIYDKSNNLTVATKEGNSWKTEVIANGLLEKQYVINGGKSLHCAYAVRDGGVKLYYATNKNGQWESTLVAKAHISFSSTQMLVDGNNDCHLFYSSLKGCFYSKNGGSPKRIAAAGSELSMAKKAFCMDANNKIYMAYTLFNVKKMIFTLKLSEFDNGRLKNTIEVSKSGNEIAMTGKNPSLFVDAKGTLNIFYYDFTKSATSSTMNLVQAIVNGQNMEKTEIVSFDVKKATENLDKKQQRIFNNRVFEGSAIVPALDKDKNLTIYFYNIINNLVQQYKLTDGWKLEKQLPAKNFYRKIGDVDSNNKLHVLISKDKKLMYGTLK